MILHVKMENLVSIGAVANLVVVGHTRRRLQVQQKHVIRMVLQELMLILHRFVIVVPHICVPINSHGMLAIIFRMHTEVLISL